MITPKLRQMAPILAVTLVSVSLGFAEPSTQSRARAISAPQLEFSYEVVKARPNNGLFELHVRGDGTVAEVAVLKTSGLKRADDEAIAILLKWRMEPGTPVKKVVVPVNFSRQRR